MNIGLSKTFTFVQILERVFLMVGVFFIILGGFFWAVDTLIRYPLVSQGISPERLVFAEQLFLTLIFLPFLIKDAKKYFKSSLSAWFSFFIIGSCGSALATLAFTKAFVLINPSLVILLQKLQPLISISLARILLGEKTSRPFLLWAAVALFGGFLISSPDIMPGLINFNFNVLALSNTTLAGYGFALMAVVIWGSSTVFGKKLSAKGFNEIQIMGGRFFFGFLFMSVYLLYQTGSLALDWGYQVNLKILTMNLCSGIGAMFFFYRGLKRLPARSAALAEMFFPLIAIVINWIVLDARLAPIQLVGGALLILSSTVIQIKKY